MAGGPLGRLAEHGLEAGEGFLDGVEVRAVGWEEQQGCARRLYQFTHPGLLVARQVVHDDDIAAPQLGCEDLGHIGFEPFAIDGPVEHHRGDHPGQAEARDQRGCLAMPVWKAHAQALASGATAVAAGHVGRRPGLVDEDQARRIEVELAIEPGPALPQDGGPILLDRVPGLFLRVMPWRTKKRWSVEFATTSPAPANSTRSSSRVMSLRASHSARISSRRSSIRRERVSPPWGLGAKSPVARRCACQRIAVEGALSRCRTMSVITRPAHFVHATPTA